jgi:hypothetical protein
MRLHALPAHTRCSIAFALLLSTSCGREREPWYGFELLPAEEVPQDGSGGSSATDPSTVNAGSAPSAAPDTSVGTAPAGTQSAAGSGSASDRTAMQPAAGVQTGSPNTSSEPGRETPETPATPVGPATSFRITELHLRDPHVFAGTQDLTEQEVLGQSVNRTLIPAKLTRDEDGDGALDVSVIALLAPFDPTAAPGAMPTLTFVNADCPVSGGGACKPQQGGSGLETTWTLEQRPSGKCLEPLPNTTSNFQPAITTPDGPCFLTTGGNDLMMDLGGIKIQVTEARVSATYQMQPQGLVKGLLSGFVTRRAAMQATLPSPTGSSVGGETLSTYIRSRDYDQSSSPNGDDGFWMYLNFVAKPIEYAP